MSFDMHSDSDVSLSLLIWGKRLASLDGQFDIIFLDADKVNYTTYISIILDKKLLSARGVIFCDNGACEAQESPIFLHSLKFSD